MTGKNCVVAMFEQHDGAEAAVKQLQLAGIDMKKLSIVGKGYHTEENVVGFYSTGDRMRYWGRNGAFWGGMWGLLFGSAFFIVPGVGPLIAAGPVVLWIVGALEGAAVVGGLSALGAGLYGVGIPKKSVIEYETSLKAGAFMLVFHGSPGDVAHAKEILSMSSPTDARVYGADVLVPAVA